MPGSAVEGKDMVREFCIRNNIRRVLDVGPGEGTYFRALQGTTVAVLDGVEIFPPYLEEFGLSRMYSNLYWMDIYDFDYSAHEPYDLVIMGDVIEHMTEERGRKVIADAVKNARYAVVSVPIYGYAQGIAHGNIYETHVEQYSDESMREVLKDYNILESLKGEIVGVYIFEAKK